MVEDVVVVLCCGVIVVQVGIVLLLVDEVGINVVYCVVLKNLEFDVILVIWVFLGRYVCGLVNNFICLFDYVVLLGYLEVYQMMKLIWVVVVQVDDLYGINFWVGLVYWKIWLGFVVDIIVFFIFDVCLV